MAGDPYPIRHDTAASRPDDVSPLRAVLGPGDQATAYSSSWCVYIGSTTFAQPCVAVMIDGESKPGKILIPAVLSPAQMREEFLFKVSNASACKSEASSV